jgi:hypothetical protein
MKQASHYKSGADTNHFLGLCRECDGHYLAAMTLGEVERWYRYGKVDQVAFEAYMHVWSTGAARYGSTAHGWTDEPTDPEVIDLVAAIRSSMYADRAPDGQCRDCGVDLFRQYVGLRDAGCVDRSGGAFCPNSDARHVLQ